MKIRIRSMETLMIETSDPSTTLDELKTLIASKFSSSSVFFPRQSIRLSLNRVDELLSPTPESPLHSLGLTSGDLLFFSLLPLDSKDPAAETLESDSNPTHQVVNPDAETLDSQPFLERTSSENDLVDTEMEPKPPLVPEMEKGEINGNLGLLMVSVHSVFLESGFVVYSSGGDGSRLPQNWGKLAPFVSFQYSLPELAGPHGAGDMKVAVLKFSAMGNYLLIYGIVGGDRPDVYRVCLDVPKLVSCLKDSMGEREEGNDVFKIRKIVKDELCLPLLIDICENNGLTLPPCFARLPTELKLKIIKLLKGVDVANLGCTCTNLRYLSLNDEVWSQKFFEEFVLCFPSERGVIGSRWREKFVGYWVKRKNANKKRTRRDNMSRMPNISTRRYNPFTLQRIPVIEDYDTASASGILSSRGPLVHPPRYPDQRNLSP